MLRKLASIAIAGAMALPSSLLAQDSASGSEIEVTGDRPIPEQHVSNNVYQLAQSNTVGRPIPRFHDPLCLSVAGLGDALNEEVSSLIEDNAREAGLEIADEGCRTNALVIIVDQPEVLVERLRDTQPDLFNTRANREIGAAFHRGDPVIGWSATAIRNSDGRPTGGPDNIIGGLGQSQDLFTSTAAGAPTNTNCIPSRISVCFSIARTNSVVVFDIERLDDVHLNQLAGYATMYLIGSPRRLLDHDELEAASVMTLFEDGPMNTPNGLSTLDRAYLRGLYSMRPNAGGERLSLSARLAYREIACGGDEELCSERE